MFLVRDKHVHVKIDTLGCRFMVVWITVRKLSRIWLLWWRSPWFRPASHGGVNFYDFSFFFFFFCKISSNSITFSSMISWFFNPLSHFSLMARRRIFSPVNGPTFFSHDCVSSWWFLHPSNYFQHFYQIFVPFLTDWFGFSVSSWSGK